ncbi:lipoate--protein ligase family protein [Bifidobacterium sp. W8109]|uniref:lipoate--protein ligase family protein n=1 Tax=Bifidobacterium TaxID=1678 RepID=UPI0018DC5651|nr:MULTISPECIES: lipoate--protein ligase family protein [Bifidobacterium]MBH9971630.1 lipoate--protein ligase family protein [Bifidobacterium asteroides]MBH9984314.1 lipoate--protein ligase family protein [Bifidobacterium asteroides]MBI0073200.1 lipoate--protein ligase family protein [Bifidobacterium sp. W8110]
MGADGLNPARLRGVGKQMGGKLAAVTLTLGQGSDSRPAIASCRVDGDFFTEPAPTASQEPEGDHGAVSRLESAICDLPLPLDPDLALERLDRVMAEGDGQRVVGVSPWTLVTALERALPAEMVIQRQGESDQPSSAPDRTFSRQSQPDEVECLRRWSGLKLDLIRDGPRQPVMQMAMDQALNDAVAQGRLPPTLRIWNWSAPAVILGRFQSLSREVHVERARSLGFTLVRRCTGGGTMVIQPDRAITYSLYLPLDFVKGADLIDSYRICDYWLVRGLRMQGIQAGWQGMNDIASPRGKMGGAAQRRLPSGARGPGGLLHHTTLSYSVDAELMAQVLKVAPEKFHDKAVTSVRSRVDPIDRQTSLSRQSLIDALLDTLPSLVEDLRISSPAPEVEQRARTLVRQRYGRGGWTAQIA